MIDLKGAGLARKSTKQAEIGLDGLQTILSIGLFRAAEEGAIGRTIVDFRLIWLM